MGKCLCIALIQIVIKLEMVHTTKITNAFANVTAWSFMCLLLTNCQQTIDPLYKTSIIELDANYTQQMAQEIQEEVSVTVTDGLALNLWASDTLVTDPIAISIDDQGRLFYTHANRLTNSEFDIRGHKNWMAATLSFKTVEDRREFLKATFPETNEEGQRHLKDLNQDGVLDWRDLTVEKEKVWFIEDTNGDGMANRTQLYLEDFNEEITDLANGLEAYNGEVFIAVGPDLWRTQDRDKDGIADIVTSISHGFAVHIGFGAHGMSGAKIGPDGRIWWGIGDIGMNVVDQDGQSWEYPNRGVIVRSELDGSGFEVYAAGVRNTHEFVFDKYGNLISVDNDGDHEGERERLVYLINGSDTGWRINWQFGKYSDPKNNTYKVWMDENMHVPAQAGQAAYFLPPIVNYVNGPTGMVYNPGTALDSQWYDHFFVAEFRGTPVNSPLHAFTLKPKGASFELEHTQEVVRGLLPTGVDFGPDGALYFSDWVDGWNTKQKGRIWKLDVPGQAASALRSEVKNLLAGDFNATDTEQLGKYLGHQDMRIRQKAQFELASRGTVGYDLFNSLLGAANQMVRVHSIWGIGQVTRKGDKGQADILVPLLNDQDAEIVTQAAKILGDIKHTGSAASLIPLLEHASLRVQLHAVEALGRMEYSPAFDAIVDLLEKNNNQDKWLRHAGMIALARISEVAQLADLKNHQSKAVRVAAVVALRRLKSPEIALFLKDDEESIVTEAARGINDDLAIMEALPALAELLNNTRFQNEALLRRSINANFRIGESQNIDQLVSYTQSSTAPAEMRGEALQTLGNWSNPSVYDRVDGRYLGDLKRDDSYAVQQLSNVITSLLRNSHPTVQQQAALAAGSMKIDVAESELQLLVQSNPHPAVRSTALNALFALDSENLNQALQSAFKDNDPTVRSSALAILPKSNMPEETSINLFKQIMNSGSYPEQQVVLASLGGMNSQLAVQTLSEYLSWLKNGNAKPEIQLDIVEAINEQGDASLLSVLAEYQSTKPDDPLSPYIETLVGGSPEKGREIFRTHEAAQCIRCHTIFETGGTMGPGLYDVGAEHAPKELLTALVLPSDSYEEGYHMVTLTLSNGETVTGLVQDETTETIIIRSGNQQAQEIEKSSIKEQKSIPSSMPPMGGILTKKEIRDVIAFLGTLQGHHVD